MSDERALLSAIWEHPHEDTPRLVFADWLDENGDPDRAEFIRVQIELARLGEWDDSPRRAELQEREKELRAAHAMAWKAGLPKPLRQRTGLHRGFPSPQLRAMPSSKFLKLTANDFAGAPLWNYRLPTNHKLLPAVLAFPLLLRVGTLDLRFWLEGEDDVRLFVASPNVRNVADLNIGGPLVGDDGIAELAANPAALPHLRRLNLEFSNLTARGMEALVASPLADRLEDLDLSSNDLGPEGIEVLAGSPRLARLKRLDLASCAGGGKGKLAAGKALRRLCESPHLAALKVLNLYSCGLDDANLAQVCRSRPAVRLAELSLLAQYPRLTDAGAEALAAWPGLASVRRLILACNEIGAAGGPALARSPHLGNITELNLRANPVEKNKRAVKALRDRFGKALRV